MKNYISPQTTSVSIAMMAVLMLSNNAGIHYEENNGLDPEQAF